MSAIGGAQGGPERGFYRGATGMRQGSRGDAYLGIAA